MLEKHSTTQAHFFMIGLLVALAQPFKKKFACTFFGLCLWFFTFFLSNGFCYIDYIL